MLVSTAIIYSTFFYCELYFSQTTPSHIIGQLDKCIREASTLDGVLEFRHEHFWTVAFGMMVRHSVFQLTSFKMFSPVLCYINVPATCVKHLTCSTNVIVPFINM